MTRPKNRGLVYARRSTDKQETSLPSQLEWAIAAAQQHGVALDAAIADLLHMQTLQLHSYKDIRLDDGISGSDLTRPGFLAVSPDTLADKTISHLFIYKRDRFARPNDAMQVAQIEKQLLTAGITLIFSDTVSTPIRLGDQSIMRDEPHGCGCTPAVPVAPAEEGEPSHEKSSSAESAGTTAARRMIDEDCREEKQTAEEGNAPSSAVVVGDRSPNRLNRSQPEGISITKVSRGDWIRTSDLLNPIQAR